MGHYLIGQLRITIIFQLSNLLYHEFIKRLMLCFVSLACLFFLAQSQGTDELETKVCSLI